MPHSGICLFFVLLSFVAFCSAAPVTTFALYTVQGVTFVPHVIQNHRVDIPAYPDPQQETANIPSIAGLANPTGGTVGSVGSMDEFTFTGSGSQLDSDADEAYIKAINDANTGGISTRLQIFFEEPGIHIDPIGDRRVGDKFNITATTNLAVGDKILFEIYSPTFQPTLKNQSVQFSGAAGTVTVTRGTNGLNEISFPVDTSSFKPDVYLVTVNAILLKATATARFNVLEAGAVNITTPSVFPGAPTGAPAINETTTPITTVVPTRTPAQPGFGTLDVLMGFGVVAFLVVRRH